jgi:DNA anti-recombination protein RmuC
VKWSPFSIKLRITKLQAVGVQWREHANADNVRAIAETSRELLTRLSRFTGDFSDIRAKLEKAVSEFHPVDSGGNLTATRRSKGSLTPPLE